MQIVVTGHAIQRYRERLFDYDSSTQKIKRKIEDIMRRGRQVKIRPGINGACVEVKLGDIAVVAIRKAKETVVITCLGDMCYRKWIKTQDSYIRISGRTLYRNNELLLGV